MRWARMPWTGTSRALIFNASSLVGTMGVNSGLGFLYWWVAAKLYDTAAVGLASAVLSAMTLIASMCLFGLGTLLIGEIRRTPIKAPQLVATSLMVVGLASTLVALLFVLLAPLISAEFLPLRASIWTAGLFVVGTVLAATALVLDQAVIGLLRGELQFWRNAFFGTIKLGALIVVGLWVAQHTGMTVFATWVFGMAISIGLVIALLWRRHPVPAHMLQPEWTLIRELGWSALSHHVLNVALQSSSLILPLIVTAILTPTLNAYFYVAAMMLQFAFVGPASLATALYAVSANDHQAMRRQIRMTLCWGVLIGIAANLALVVLADPLLRLFGPAYADNAAVPLQVLCLGVFPLVISEHYVAICRIFSRTNRAIPVVLAGNTFKLILAAIGASMMGLQGLAIGTLIGACLEAMVELPLVARVVWRGEKPFH